MNSILQPKRVGVTGNSPDSRYRFLLQALGQLYPVEFCDAVKSDAGGWDGLIVLDGRLEQGMAAAARGIPAFVVGTEVQGITSGVTPEVQFGTSSVLEECLRGQLLADRRLGAFPTLGVQDGDEVVASRNGQVFWLNRPAGSSSCQWVATSPPSLVESEFLFQHLNGGCFMRLLPLANFLRQLTKDTDWHSPGTRACFVIDDPSLYSRSYGFVNYRRLADHARRHGYCVAIASIPIDSWWVNRAVATTFRADSARLSVLIHGNNHTSRELLFGQNGATGLESAAQALRRMDRLRQRHGINVLKIMEAPHGAITVGVLPHMLRLGYEAALVTTELLVRYNPAIAWSVTIGTRRSEVLARGLPILPRIILSADWKGDALLAAFLRQPVVMAGHHHDARRGLELLENIGRTLTGITGVSWANLRDILQTNYEYKVTGDVLTVRLYSRRVKIALPPGIRFLRVERPWLEDGGNERLVLGSAQGTAELIECGRDSEPFAIGQADTVEVASQLSTPLDSAQVLPPPARPWPYARKFFMEIRDRFAPALFGLGWPGNWPYRSRE